MPKSKAKKLPRFNSTNELVDFFETHDLGPYLDSMPEAHFDFSSTKSKVWAEIDPKLSEQLSSIARSKRISSKRLLNTFIRRGIRQEKNSLHSCE